MNAPHNWNQPGQGPNPASHPPVSYAGGPPPPGGMPPPGRMPPFPPRKKRTGLIIGLVIALVVLAAGGYFGSLYFEYRKAPGGGPGEQPIAQCELSDEIKKEAKVSSFRLVGKPERPDENTAQNYKCAWEQTAGKDGQNPRLIFINVDDYNKLKYPDLIKKQVSDTYNSTAIYNDGKAKPVDDLGDEAMFVSPNAPSNLTHIELKIRKGNVVWSIGYSGKNKGFFSDSAFPTSEAESVLLKVGQDLVNRS